jgi:hypothetical protein
MRIIQHNKLYVPQSFTHRLSDNLIAFVDENSKRFSFDNANVYHLNNNNLVEYKDIITSSIKAKLIKNHRSTGSDMMKDIIKAVNDYYENLQNKLPTSMIVFEHVYSSLTETSMLFFKEHHDMLLIDTTTSTLEFAITKNMFSYLPLNDNYVARAVTQSVGYESSSTKGVFPFTTFLLPFNENSFKIDFEKSQTKSLELQVRILQAGQDKFENLNISDDKILNTSLKNIDIVNTRLLHNNIIIFNEYALSDYNVRDLISSYLMPFIDDLNSKYEIIDEIPVALTKEYYDHFKANIKPVIDMAIC